MKNHPAADIFPMMGNAEIQALAEDIKENGQQEPVGIYDGMILDGRNRAKACLIADVEMEYVEIETDDPFQYALSANLHRRHLDASQRSMIAAKYQKTITQKSENRMKSGVKPDPMANLPQGSSREIAAEKLNVSGRSVDAASKVLDKGTETLQQAVEAGEIPVSTAAKIAELPKREQNKIAKSDKPKHAAKEAIEPDKPDWRKIRSIAAQHINSGMRAIDDLNRIRPYTDYQEALDAIKQVAVIVEGWK